MKYVVDSVAIHIDDSEREIRTKISRKLSIPVESFRYEIVGRTLVYVDGEAAYSIKAIVDTNAFIRDTRIGFFGPNDSLIIQPTKFKTRPIIVGAGLSGLFCAYVLAKAGGKPLVFEQGGSLEERELSTNDFSATGEKALSSCTSGLGGFYGFCGGPVYNDKQTPFQRFAIDTLLELGAPSSLSVNVTSYFSAQEIRRLVAKLSKEITSLGGEILLKKKVTGFISSFGKIKGVRYVDESGKRNALKGKCVVLATGNPTPDFVATLVSSKIKVEPRNFYFGVLAEIKNKDACQVVYRVDSVPSDLPPFRYAKNISLPSGRKGVICHVLPNGRAVNYSSKAGEVLVESAYPSSDSGNMLVSILVEVRKEDFKEFGSSGPLSFMNNVYGSLYRPNEPYFAPLESAKDFIAGTEPLKIGKTKPSYKPGVYLSDIASTCPLFLKNDLQETASYFVKSFPGCKPSESLLLGFTCARTSPLDVSVDEDFMTSLKGLSSTRQPFANDDSILDEAGRGVACAFSILNQD